MDEANRAERLLGDAIGRHIIEAIDVGFQPPFYVAAGAGGGLLSTRKPLSGQGRRAQDPITAGLSTF
jgi:hypothetical protein